MSPPAVAKSLVAAMCADTAGLPKLEKRADKPARSFSQMPALVAVRQTAKADNAVVTSEPKAIAPQGDKADPTRFYNMAIPTQKSEHICQRSC